MIPIFFDHFTFELYAFLEFILVFQFLKEHLQKSYFEAEINIFLWEGNAWVIIITSFQKFGEKMFIFVDIWLFTSVDGISPPTRKQHPGDPPHLGLHFLAYKLSNCIYWPFFMSSYSFFSFDTTQHNFVKYLIHLALFRLSGRHFGHPCHFSFFDLYVILIWPTQRKRVKIKALDFHQNYRTIKVFILLIKKRL